MQGFTDIHTHIMNGIDDGAKTIEDSLNILKIAYDDGTRNIILTPHFRRDCTKNEADFLVKRFETFKEIANEKFPDIELYLGCEIYWKHDVPELLDTGRIRTMNGTSYCLVEFPETVWYTDVINSLNEIMRYGYDPILAHAERYQTFLDKPKRLDEVVDLGVPIQLNADSIMGDSGNKVRRFCEKLLKQNKVSFVASDTHNVKSRPPHLNKCYEKVKKKCGEEYADSVFFKNAEEIISLNK